MTTEMEADMATAEQWTPAEEPVEQAEAERLAVLEEEFLADAPDPGDDAELDAYLDRLLYRLALIDAEDAKNRAVYEKRIKPIRDWLDEETARNERRRTHITETVRALTLAYDYGPKKSRNLPSGTFGTRTVPAKLSVVDPAAALAFAKAHDIPIKVTESVGKTSLKEYAESTGITPDGCEIVPKSETFYARPNPKAFED